MSEKVISEREAVLRERKAYFLGMGCSETCNDCRRRVEREFPLPKRKVPRVVRVSGYAYRVIGGVVEYEGSAGRWYRSPLFDADSVAKVSALLADPTEEVEDDGSASTVDAEKA